MDADLATLVAEVRRVAAGLRQRLAAGRQVVEAAAGSVRVGEVTEKLIAAAVDHAGMAPLEDLLCALALKRAIMGTPLETPWRRIMAWRASTAIYDAEALDLFPLRLELLDEALADPRVSLPRAMLLFQRANTRQAIGEREPRDTALVHQDLSEAYEVAVAEGDVNTIVRVLAVMAQRLSTPPAADELSRRVPDEKIATALGQIPPPARALLLRARAQLARTTEPERAAAYLEDALVASVDAPGIVLDLQVDLVQALTFAGRLEDAARRGREFLLEQRGAVATVTVGLLHAAVGQALMGAHKLEEARTELAAAIELLGGRDAGNAATARLHLAAVELAAGRLDAADAQLRAVESIEELLSPLHKRDLAGLRAALAARRGDPAEQRRALRQAESLGGPPEHVLRLRLERAVVDLQRDRTVADLDDVLAQAMTAAGEPGHPELDAAIMKVCAEPRCSLSRESVERVRAWALRRKFPSLAARLLHGGGRTDEAMALLRSPEAAAERVGAVERLRCVHWLINVLPATAHQERWQACLELEELLESVADDPHARLDLATGMRMAAADRPERRERAWHHAQRALSQLGGQPVILDHAHRLLSQLVLDFVRASHTVSTAEIAAKATWLTGELRMPENDRGEIRLSVASQLLIVGPLAHPDAIEAARRLLSLARTDLACASGEAAAALMVYERRLAWITARLAGTPRGEPGEASLFDDVPDWFLAIMSGEAERPPPGASEVAKYLEIAWRVRPDLHERLRVAQERWHAEVGPGDAEGQVVSVFNEGVALLRKARQDPLASELRIAVAAARSRLEEASALARRHGLATLFNCLLSRGNAWRLEPDADVELALSCYEEASTLEATVEDRATLDKVHADALVSRGRPEDLREASVLIEASLAVRRDGYLRAEALVTAAQIAEAHPDLDELGRARGVAEHTMSACRADRRVGEQVLTNLVAAISTWERLAPSDERPGQLRAELRALYPGRLAEIAATAASSESLDSILEVVAHPAGRVFLEMRLRLASPRERRIIPRALAERLGAARLEQAEHQARDTSLCERPEQAEAELRALAGRDHGDAQPGALAAIALLTVNLARCRRRSASEARQATLIAAAAVEGVTAPTVVSLVLQELGATWSPGQPDGDPVCDFELAVDLLRRAVTTAGGPGKAAVETVGHLARALRHVPAVNDAALREARDLYEVALSRAQSLGDPDQVANILANLADVEEQIGEGDRKTRLLRALPRVEEAAKLAHAPQARARYQSNLAWTVARIGFNSDGAEAISWLERAIKTFSAIDLGQLDGDVRFHVECNRATSAAELAVRRGDHQSAIAIARAEVERMAASGRPHALATANHNLATSLTYGHDPSAQELQEALRLWREAAKVRTRDRDPRHAWETAFGAGRAILVALDRRRGADLGMSVRRAWTEGRRWLEDAVIAARTLGRGEELANAALALAGFASHTSVLAEAEAVADEAWSAVRDAMPFLLRTPELRSREAALALRVAFDLAKLHGIAAVATPSPDLSFILVTERAATVQRWLLRAQVPARRPLRARLVRPPSVAAATWSAWRAALDSADESSIAAALRAVCAEEPTFLGEDGETSWVAQWLQANPDGAAVASFLAGESALTWLITPGGEGKPEPCILGHRAPAAPVGDADLVRALQQVERAPAAASTAVDAMSAWARDTVTRTVTRVLGRQPPAVLWCPGPGLRLIPPAAIWPRSVVSVTHALEGPADRGHSGRESSTLLALADPGPGHPDSLGDWGLAATRRLAEAAGSLGRTRIMASSGARFGEAVLGRSSAVRDTPVSPQDLLADATTHATIILVAHGEVTAHGASLVCVDREGNRAYLTEADLAAHPQAFAGASVLLLTCSAGQLSADLANPAGVAGPLLIAGARSVVAPLWPVRLDAATDVAEVVLRAAAAGDPPARALAHVHRGLALDSAAGSAEPPARTVADLSYLAFVAWVG